MHFPTHKKGIKTALPPRYYFITMFSFHQLLPLLQFMVTLKNIAYYAIFDVLVLTLPPVVLAAMRLVLF